MQQKPCIVNSCESQVAATEAPQAKSGWDRYAKPKYVNGRKRPFPADSFDQPTQPHYPPPPHLLVASWDPYLPAETQPQDPSKHADPQCEDPSEPPSKISSEPAEPKSKDSSKPQSKVASEAAEPQSKDPSELQPRVVSEPTLTSWYRRVIGKKYR